MAGSEGLERENHVNIFNKLLLLRTDSLQVDVYQISRTISNHIICMVAVFCLQYSIGVEKDSEQVYKCLLACERKYVSLFHPLSLLGRDVSSNVQFFYHGGGVFTCTIIVSLYSEYSLIAIAASFIATQLEKHPHTQ